MLHAFPLAWPSEFPRARSTCPHPVYLLNASNTDSSAAEFDLCSAFVQLIRSILFTSPTSKTIQQYFRAYNIRSIRSIGEIQQAFSDIRDVVDGITVGFEQVGNRRCKSPIGRMGSISLARGANAGSVP